MKLTPDEKRRRRQERLRLIAYLMRGGQLLREDLPAGEVAWVRRSRSGHPFSNRVVSRMQSRQVVTVRGEPYSLVTQGDGSLALKGPRRP